MATPTCKPLKPEFVQHILDTFTADFTTGQVFWKVSSRKRKAGDEVSQTFTANGERKQVHITFEGRQRLLLTSRVIFILYWKRDVRPGFLIDHADRNPLNDTMSPKENLRELTVVQNSLNSAARKGRKYKGTRRTSGGRFEARYQSKEGYLSFGNHDTEEEAARAYDRGILKLFGDVAYTNFPVTDYPDIVLPRKKHSPYRGVTKHSGKFVSQFMYQGQSYYGGRFDTPSEAFAVTQATRQGLGLKPYPQPQAGV